MKRTKKPPGEICFELAKQGFIRITSNTFSPKEQDELWKEVYLPTFQNQIAKNRKKGEH